MEDVKKGRTVKSTYQRVFAEISTVPRRPRLINCGVLSRVKITPCSKKEPKSEG
jgi:hypothetical protein